MVYVFVFCLFAFLVKLFIVVVVVVKARAMPACWAPPCYGNDVFHTMPHFFNIIFRFRAVELFCSFMVPGVDLAFVYVGLNALMVL